jgi:hypothetical protein
MKQIKLKMHSLVDVITNSSTVIYTYQDGCEKPAKELINEMLKLTGETTKTAEDLFYFGVFLDDDSRYLEYACDHGIEGVPYPDYTWDDPKRKEYEAANDKWVTDIQTSILKGEIERPDWFNRASEAPDYGWEPDTVLWIEPKEGTDAKYAEFIQKISTLLNSVSADGGRDG